MSKTIFQIWLTQGPTLGGTLKPKITMAEIVSKIVESKNDWERSAGKDCWLSFPNETEEGPFCVDYSKITAWAFNIVPNKPLESEDPFSKPKKPRK